MDTRRVKAYAPKARKQFMEAVKRRLEKYGITEKKIEACTYEGDIARIGSNIFTAREGKLREKLVKRIENTSYIQVLENAAYTWFNRFAAIRYMELKGFLSHGRKVLSHPDKEKGFQILDEAMDIDLAGLDKEKVKNYKLDGGKDEELYRLLILAQCRELNKAMQFLFEAIDDETELLLPDNLTATNSIIRSMVDDLPEEDWDDVEVIGWLYQFYISEKKDEVIGKVVKSEDIPAATQLFTPNWIVKYLVQNSIGRQWMLTYPNSHLKDKMEYYIEPAEQTEEVKAKLAEITPSEINPVDIKVLDPACGSGHILVEAYNLLKEIYVEKGYRDRDVPELILKNNIFGLDIDDRAAQMAGFALMMMARQDDRRIFDRDIELNICSLQESSGLDASEVAEYVIGAAIKVENGDSEAYVMSHGDVMSEYHSSGVTKEDIVELLVLFKQAKTFGSLISIPEKLVGKLSSMAKMVDDVSQSNVQHTSKHDAEALRPFIQQSIILAQKYDAVIANPPYMGGKGMNGDLKEYAKNRFPNSKSDLFAMFIEHGFTWLKPCGANSMVTMQSWMFLSSYEKMREDILNNSTIECMAHMGNGVMKIAFGTNATVFRNVCLTDYKGSYSYTTNDDILDSGVPSEFPIENERLKTASADDFKKIPGSPIAYWIGQNTYNSYIKHKILSATANAKSGQNTGDNDRFIRFWPEVSLSEIKFDEESLEQTESNDEKWYPYNKGGNYRRWYGNFEHIINWANNGEEIKNYAVKRNNGKHWSRYIQNLDYMLCEGLTWSFISSSYFGIRYTPKGCLFDYAGCSLFPNKKEHILPLLACLSSKTATHFIRAINPTMNLQPGTLSTIPIVYLDSVSELVYKCIDSHKSDWNSFETSWDFATLPVTNNEHKGDTLEISYNNWRESGKAQTAEMKNLEEENNRIFIDAYGLQDELTPDVPIEQITLTVNPAYRYGKGKTDEEYEELFRTDSMRELISYSIGCMMGRYSLDEKGLIYAHSGNEGFDHSKYTTFPADEDGIIPLTDLEWFPDDATNRFIEFIEKVWGKDTKEQNLKFVADSLSPKRGETPEETIRRYMSANCFKDHMKRYKRRPIYWLFSSGKEKAFEALVYLHRYNESTLSRMRSEYVNPLQTNMNAYLARLDKSLEDSSLSSSEQKKLEKEREILIKKITELRTFDEQLKHYADQRISIDLDDGVKVNYGKFGDLLAEVKNITGGKDDD